MEISIDEVINAYFTCIKGKRWTREAINFSINYMYNIRNLYIDLKYDKYEPLPEIAFVVKDPKPREVFAAKFRDRIVQHILINRLKVYYLNYFNKSSFNCIPGGGNLNAVHKLQELMRTHMDHYIIGLDIKNFFVSINRNIMNSIITEFITNNCDNNIDSNLKLMHLIIDRDVTQNCIKVNCGKDWNLIPKEKSLFNKLTGYPIGDISSQYNANLYLTVIDNYIELLGYPEVRYADDYRILVPKDKIKEFISEISKLHKDLLNLELSKTKIIIQPVKKGCPFVGYFVKPYKLFSSKRIKIHVHKLIYELNNKYYNKTLDTLFNTVNSYLGYLIHCNSLQLRKLLIKTVLISTENLFKTDNKYSKLIKHGNLL